MKPIEPDIVLPLRFFVEAASLKERNSDLKYVADARDRQALAEYAGLVDVVAMVADFDIARSGRFGVKVSGQIKADVIQTCVVSLEPFAAKVSESFEVRFAPEPTRKSTSSRNARAIPDIEASVLEVPFDGADPPEVLRDGRIDLGAIAVEYFILGLDPYPRRPEADLSALADGIKNLEIGAGPLPQEVNSPFSRLSELKNVIKPE